MPGIPEVRKKKFYEKHWFLESLGVAGAVITGTASTPLAIRTIAYPVESTTKSDQILAWVSLGGVVVLVAAAVVKLIHGLNKDRKETDENKLDGLHAVLHVIHSIVRHKKGFGRNERDRLRVTIHRVIPAKKAGEAAEQAEQMFDYVGGDGKGAGRKFSCRSGIIGRAIRERDIFAVSRKSEDHASFIMEMVREWGYTKEEAAKLTSDRNSWMAIPIYYKGADVTGVVYLDSNERGIFSSDVRDAVKDACNGLAVFISERY